MMSIKTRLSTIIILIGGMLLLITGFMIWTQVHSHEQEAFSTALVDALNSVMDTSSNINRQLSEIKDFLLSGNEESRKKSEQYGTAVRQSLNRWSLSVQNLIKQDLGFRPSDLNRIELAKKMISDSLDSLNRVMELQGEGETEAALEMLRSEVEPEINSVIASHFTSSLNEIKLKGGGAYTSIFARANNFWKQGIQVLAIICLLILLISYRLLWTIFQPIDILKNGAGAIGKGQFSHRISLDSKDELGKLAEAFNGMAENLQRTTISRDYMDNIVRSMHGSLIVTSPERYIQTVNKATCEMLEMSEAELRGMPLESIFADEASLRQKHFDELLQKGHIQYVESAYRAKSGGIIPVLFSASVMKGDEGEEQGIILISADITQRKEMEEKQEELLGELESVNKELQDFAYIVSHDLKAPLRGIRSLSQWIVDDYADKLDDEGQETLSLLQSRAQRMQSLIDGILQYSKAGRSKDEKTSVDLNDLIQEVIDCIDLPSHIRIIFKNHLPTLVCERTRMAQLFQNLLSNAVKYMDKESGRVKIGCLEKQTHWQFSVSDNGPGIDPKHFERIFKVFQTLKPKDEYESTGIGLAVVKKVVEIYGGKIWLESELGKGSTFFFTLAKNHVSLKEEEHAVL